MKVLLINDWYNQTLQNLIYFFAKRLKNNFNWTGKRWYINSFLPLLKEEEESYLDEPQALTDLQNNKYDAVIYSDGGVLIYLSSHLDNTVKVIIDTLDQSYIPEIYWKNIDLYFKCQLLKNDYIYLINKEKVVGSVDVNNNLLPFPLFISHKYNYFLNCLNNIKNFEKKYDLFFNGSCYPQKRVDVINKIKENDNINFYGGLYRRLNSELNCDISDNVMFHHVDIFEFIQFIKNSKISLSCWGNGYNCYRHYEILALNECLLLMNSPVYFGEKELVDGYNCIIFDENNKNLIEKILYYLDNENLIDNIKKNAKEFYKQYYQPQKLVDYIIKNIERKING